MADLIPNADTFLVHTGNIVNWNRKNKKLTQSPTDELSECISSTISDWIADTDKSQLQDTTYIECLNSKYLEKLPQKERTDLKLTAKIFLSSVEKETLEESINRVLCELGTTYIETVLLCVPENKQNLGDLKEVWKVLEECVSKEKVFSLGVSDLNKDQLEDLHSWAKVKPSIAQVNLSVCCVVPPEMQQFAKDNDIQLLTHNEPQDIFPSSTFQQVLSSNFTVTDIEQWKPVWIVRYSVLIKCRGVLKTKGYIMKAVKG